MSFHRALLIATHCTTAVWVLLLLQLSKETRATDGQTAEALPRVIENVRANEALYTDLEIFERESYELGEMPSLAGSPLLKRYNADGRTVYQAGLTYLNQTTKQITPEGELQTITTVQGFDGETTRILEQDSFANVHEGRFVDHRLFVPHMTLFKGWALSFSSLSDFLAATECDGDPFSVRVLRAETLEGLRCVVVQGDLLSTHELRLAIPGPEVAVRIWLAVERNYLPIRIEAYRKWTGPVDWDRPFRIATVQNMREVEPGLWLPMHTKDVSYDVKALAEENRMLEPTIREVIVQQVRLNPNYDISLFRDIKFPPGIAVYEVRDGEIVNSYITEQTADSNVPGVMWWFVGVNVLVLPLLIWMMVRRRRRRGSGDSQTPVS